MNPKVNLFEIRQHIIAALCEDDALFENLVLKGGNALTALQLSPRASLDIDFSTVGNLEEIQDLGDRMENTLKNHFQNMGFYLFGFELIQKPEDPHPLWNAGHRALFKLIPVSLAKKLNFDLEKMSKQALYIGDMTRKFKIDISHFEYCAHKELHDIADVPVYVYAPSMIVSEKLRALCQQLPAYPYRKPATKTPRPRDFYDIYSILEKKPVDFAEPAHREVLEKVFEIKQVDLALLKELSTTQAYHERDWASVQASLSRSCAPFAHYFQFVLALIQKLESNRVI